jgi:hypothetical protein
MYKQAKNLILLAVSAAFLLSFTIDSDAQTRRKKRAPRKPAAVRPQPVYTADPIIVSRASDLENQTTTETVTVPVELAGAADDRDKAIAEIADRIKALELASKGAKGDEKQKLLLLNLDILSRAEQRTEALRKQRFEMIERESAIRTKLDQIDADIRPEMIERAVALAGSLRPEELREARRKNLDAERRNLQTLLADVQSSRTRIEATLTRAEDLVEKLRTKLEKDIDAALVDEKP